MKREQMKQGGENIPVLFLARLKYSFLSPLLVFCVLLYACCHGCISSDLFFTQEVPSSEEKKKRENKGERNQNAERHEERETEREEGKRKGQ